MSEQTVFRMSDLPDGQDYVWHPDLNLVELRRGLDLEGKQAAVAALQKRWGREHLRLVETA